MKKRVLFCVLLVLLLSLCAACGAQNAQPTPTPTPSPAAVDLGDESAVLFTVEGADVDSMTLGEFLALEQTTETLSRTNSKGVTITGTYTGVTFNTLKVALGIDEFSSITLVAADDWTTEYTKEILEDPATMFAVIQDGAPIESYEDGTGRMWLCVSESFTANYWAKYVVKIVVEP